MKHSNYHIRLFKMPIGYYCYDVNTNSIIKVSEKLFNSLMNNELNAEVKYELDQLKQNGFLKEKRPTKIEHPYLNNLKYYLSNKLDKITLQVTQKCNFRCSYCIYSESTNDLQRSHANNVMKLEDALKSIDFLISNSCDSDSVDLGFYGGEPLLEFDLIKSCVEYVKSNYPEKKMTFSITTNGTIINKEIMDFFVKYNFYPLISIDGPKHIHDRHRRFAANGKGTFPILEKNIMFMKKNYPDFMNQISFNAVINPQDDFSCTDKFFNDFEELKDSMVRSAVIDDMYSFEKNFFSDSYIESNNYEIFKAYLYALGRYERSKVSRIAIQNLDDIIKLKSFLGVSNELPESMSHSGPCVPGQSRLLVTTSGEFFPCERVSELSSVMKIGNLHDGFDFDAASKILNIASITSEECKNCWVINHCIQCAKHADNIDSFSKELKLSYCKLSVSTIDSTMRSYIALKEIRCMYKDQIGEEIEGGVYG